MTPQFRSHFRAMSWRRLNTPPALEYREFLGSSTASRSLSTTTVGGGSAGLPMFMSMTSAPAWRRWSTNDLSCPRMYGGRFWTRCETDTGISEGSVFRGWR